MAKTLTVAASIAAGQSLSGVISGSGMDLVGIQMPAAWTAAGITFQISGDGVTYGNVYDDAGTEVAITGPAAGRYVAIGTSTKLLRGVRFLKVRSGTSGAAVNQVAAAALMLVFGQGF